MRPLPRAGNRRYYRPADVGLARRIHRLLNQEGYTVRGVQKVLRDRNGDSERLAVMTETPSAPAVAEAIPSPSVDIERLRHLRNRLADALTS